MSVYSFGHHLTSTPLWFTRAEVSGGSGGFIGFQLGRSLSVSRRQMSHSHSPDRHASISLNRLHLGDYAVSICIMPFSGIEKGLGKERQRERMWTFHTSSMPCKVQHLLLERITTKGKEIDDSHLLEPLCTNNGLGLRNFRING